MSRNKKNPPAMIKSGQDFNSLMIHLSEKRRFDMYQAMKETLPSLINSVMDFNAFSHLSKEQRVELYANLDQKILSFLEDGEDLGKILRYLPPEQGMMLCEKIKIEKPSIIESANDIGLALQFLSEEQCMAIGNILVGLRSAEDLGEIFSSLSPEQITAVCKSIDLSSIQSPKDLGIVFSSLSHEQSVAAYQAMKEKCSSIIRSAEDLGPMLRCLSAKQCGDVCELMRDQLTLLIPSYKELKQVLTSLVFQKHYLEAHGAGLCAAMKKDLLFLLAQEEIDNPPLPEEINSTLHKALKSQVASWSKEYERTMDVHHTHLLKTINDLYDYSASLIIHSEKLHAEQTRAGIAGCQLAIHLKTLLTDEKGRFQPVDATLASDIEKTLEKAYTEMGANRRLGYFHSFLHFIANSLSSLKAWMNRGHPQPSDKTPIGSAGEGYFALSTRQEKVVKIKDALTVIKEHDLHAVPSKTSATSTPELMQEEESKDQPHH
ncbi:hypothetical protein [Legionella oakridgensis]|uniref:hypothetical protein n=1 Tax=Legionella oakridgensis TaxID=29423 RepID=UPI0011DE2415|nr:hypothetical protein [Legionella oakridgensis]